MDNKLDVVFHLLEHPYPEEASSQFEVWGQIDVRLLHTIDAQEISILGIQWDIAVFAEWFVDHWLSICKDSLVMGDANYPVLPSESIAEAMQRLQSREFSEVEGEAQFNWFKSLFSFREKHSLRFALRGTDTPEIFVGYNHSQGEISIASDTENWSYPFDMLSFCNHIRENLQGVLEKWLSNSSNRAASERIQTLITRLKTEIDCTCG